MPPNTNPSNKTWQQTYKQMFKEDAIKEKIFKQYVYAIWLRDMKAYLELPKHKRFFRRVPAIHPDIIQIFGLDKIK